MFSSFRSNEMEKRQLENLSAVNYLTEEVTVVGMSRAQGIPCHEIRLDEIGAIKYLINLGHTKIAFLGGSENADLTFEKRLAYRRILKKYGIELGEGWMKYGASIQNTV